MFPKHKKVSDNEKDFEMFLHKVQEVETIVKGMRSKDENVAKKATMKAELFLGSLAKKDGPIDEKGLLIKSDRTVINKKAFEDTNSPATMTTDAWMRSVEEDARQRAEDRRHRKSLANEYKVKGNKAFREREFETALKNYSEAINLVKDSSLLYTNRALTLLRLGLYTKALEDCHSALKFDENNLKAFIYKAQIFYKMRENDNANKTLDEAKRLHPKQVELIESYRESDSKRTEIEEWD